MMIQERLKDLRNLMAHQEIAAVIVPGTDPHASEYIAEHWQERQFISGFTGSAGTAVVTSDKAGLWTDSRYFLQAEVQLAGTDKFADAFIGRFSVTTTQELQNALTKSIYMENYIATLAKKKSVCHTTLLVETMSGKGSEIGRTFQELRTILDQAEEKFGSSLKERVGVCMDTCHIWDGGYDIVSNLDEVLTKFDKAVGLKRIHAVHLNDSLNILEAHKDRHAKIGEGEIGAEALCRVINHAALRNLPFILETPNEHDGYKKEIEFLRKNYKD